MTDAAARYRMVRRLGQGGMAEVFEAELVGELGFVRKVAIKRLLGDAAADPTAAQRFLDEARIASSLHHANLVSVLDFGLLDGAPFQVLELVDGLDVDALVRRAGGTLPLEIALILAAEVAHGLDHAHTARDRAGLPLGIVHRDIKPSNLLVSWAGDVKITDFGIAVARDRVARTEAGMVPGTRGFIAPEQRLRGEVDGRTDVFSLGLALHVMITGSSPLDDAGVEVGVLAGGSIPLDPTLPADVAALIARAVAPERRSRPTAAELATAIGVALGARTTTHAKTYLRDYLARLDAKPARPGALDALLGLEVVLADAIAGAPRRYTLRQTERAPTPPSASIVEPALASTLDARTTDQRPPRPKRPARGRAVIAIAAPASTGGSIAAWQLRGGAPATPATRSLARDASAPAAVADAAGAIAVRAAAPSDAAQSAAAPADAPHAPTHVPHHDAHHGAPATGSGAPASGSAAAPTPKPGTGYLQIIGDANVGARVLVDGRPAGFAPNKLEVPLGHRRVEVERKDGSRATVDVEITDFNTPAHPARPPL